MAALLVAIAAMGILMSVAMPAWRQAAQREKEEELIFRGRQYVHALQLYQRKYAAAYPPDVDILVKQKFLRKSYRDPMAEDGEFEIIRQGTPLPIAGIGQTPRGQTGRGQPAGGGATQGRPSTFTFDSRSGAVSGRASGQLGGGLGGVLGVRSKSTEESIRLYNGATHYNEWLFVLSPAMSGPGQFRPGMRGGPGGQGPGRPGMPGMPGGGGRGEGGRGGMRGGRGMMGPPGPRGPGG